MISIIMVIKMVIKNKKISFFRTFSFLFVTMIMGKDMNIKLQVCGLVIISILLGLFVSHKKLNLKGQSTFLTIIILTWVCIFLDFHSVITIHNRALLDSRLVEIICKLYPISMIWVGWINFCYVFLDLNSTPSWHRRTTRIMAVVTVIESIIVLLSPIEIYENGSDVYTFGPAIILTYIFVLFYILSILSVSIYIRLKKNSRRGTVLTFIMLLWITSAVIQGINNQFLLVGFSMSVGVMTMYIVLENPDSNLDRVLGCYNSYAMHNYIDMLVDYGYEFSLLDVSIINEKSIMEVGIDLDEVSRKVINEIEKIDGITLFKNYTAGITIVSKDKNKLDKVGSLIMKYVKRYNNAANSVKILSINDANQFESEEEIFKFLTYAKGRNIGKTSATMFVTDDIIKQYRDLSIVEKEIDLALKEDRVEVYLQPICSVKEERIVAAESLVRIRNADGTLLSPGLFIPIAEATGQILKLGERVLEKVCKFIRETDVLNYGIRAIHVNLSAIQCDDANTAKRLSNIVNAYGVNPKYISFEITETAVSESKETLLENMNSLIDYGFSFALDDFGKGESNLMYIVEMPVDTLKFDMDMTKAYFENEKAKIVVSSVSNMAKQLGLPIVAEGIETKAEVEDISSSGVEYIQGYYYSKPLPMAEFLEYLKSFVDKRSIENILQANEAYIKKKHEDEKEEVKIIEIANNRILLAEDNELSADLTKELLEDVGYEVDVASDGSIAFQAIRDSEPNKYGLVLMDIRMPFMDGYEATKYIRDLKDDVKASIPVIALTAQDSEECKLEAKNAKMDGYILKPIDVNKLNELIKIK